MITDNMVNTDSNCIQISENPEVSIIIANYNSSDYIEQSLYSAINQSLTNIEIIVVDDCSTDDSLKIIHKIATSDTRITVIELTENIGPAGARNKALKIAKGEWLSILDSDDSMHPRRLETMLKEARDQKADIVADDMLVFHNNPGIKTQNFLAEEHHQPFWVSTEVYIRSNIPAYGYLKPVIRRELLLKHKLKYDNNLRNSEDYILVLLLLLKDSRYLIIPFLGYFYRKHSASVSHRRNIQQLCNLLDAHKNIMGSIPSDKINVIKAFKYRNKLLYHESCFVRFISAIKNRHIIEIGNIAINNPTVILYLYKPIKDKTKRLLQKQQSKKTNHTKKILIISCSSLTEKPDNFEQDFFPQRMWKEMQNEIVVLYIKNTAQGTITTSDKLEVANISKYAEAFIISDSINCHDALNYTLRPQLTHICIVEDEHPQNIYGNILVKGHEMMTREQVISLIPD